MSCHVMPCHVMSSLRIHTYTCTCSYIYIIPMHVRNARYGHRERVKRPGGLRRRLRPPRHPPRRGQSTLSATTRKRKECPGVGRCVFGAPNQGVESSFCCWIAGLRLAEKLHFSQTPILSAFLFLGHILPLLKRCEAVFGCFHRLRRESSIYFTELAERSQNMATEFLS